MKEIEAKLKSDYPILWDFMETTLWPDVDGYNPIDLLHRIAYNGHPERSGKLIQELEALSKDDAFSNEDIARHFNGEDIGHPYEVVNGGNAKDFCLCMSESLAFIISLRAKT